MTNTEILNAVAQAVNDAQFRKRTKASFLGVLTNTQDSLVEKFECLRKIDSSSFTLVADTGEYNVPSTFVKFPSQGAEVSRGFVSVGTNGRFPLQSIATEILDNRYPYWRATASGTPEFYYLIKSGTPKLGFYPKPSSTFISTYGSAVYADIIYRPSAIIEDANLPFDNSYALQGVLQRMLRFQTIWQLLVEDKSFSDADRLEVKILKMEEDARDLVETMLIVPSPHGFEESHA